MLPRRLGAELHLILQIPLEEELHYSMTLPRSESLITPLLLHLQLEVTLNFVSYCRYRLKRIARQHDTTTFRTAYRTPCFIQLWVTLRLESSPLPEGRGHVLP